jgi:hypothetical protein
MSTQPINHANHLKDVFEQSLAVLSNTKVESTKKSHPISVLHGNSMPIHIDAVSLQKRALDDAAKALSTLWKVSEPKRAKI